MSMNLLKLNVLNLKEGGNNYNYVLSAADLGLDDKIFVNKINADVIAIKSIYQLEILVKFSSVLNLECDRCLDSFEYDFKGDFTLYYKPLQVKDSNIDVNEDEDNLRFLSIDKKYIDLTDDLRDFILLSIPMRKVPEEIDGVCVVCKRNFEDFIKQKSDKVEVNPVWNKLFKENNS